MQPPDPIGELRARVERLTEELGEVRRRLQALDAQQKVSDEAPVEPIAVAATAPVIPAAAAPSSAPPAPPAPAGRVQPPPLPPAPGAAKVRRHAWRPDLQRVHLWPPHDTGDAEVRLGAWWATRLGVVFAVIGIVFFGVYLSLNTPPWVKLLELLAVAATMTVGGGWLERRVPRFGQVILAGGQALFFFAAFAAYTVPALKVLESVVAALVWQGSAAAAIGAVAWWRRSPLEGALAVGLGFVAAFFSLAGGLQLWSAAAALALAGTAVAWRRWLGWLVPSILALIGYWSVYLALVGGFAGAATPLLPRWCWVLVLAGFGLFFWRDDGARADREASWFQNTNSTFALLAGWLTAWVGFHPHLDVFYLVAAVVLGLAAARRRMHARDDTPGAVLLAKASGALTLAVIAWTEGGTTELALLVQAGVMLAVNWRLRSRVLAIGAGLAWLLSLLWRFDTLREGAVPWASLAALAGLLHAVGAVVWLLEAARLVRSRQPEAARPLERLAGVLTGGLAVAGALMVLPGNALPHRLMLATVVFAAVAWRWRAHAVGAGAAAVGFLAHATLWLRIDVMETVELLVAAAVLLGPTVLFAAAGGRVLDRREHGPTAVGAVWSASAVALLTAVLVGWRLWSPALAGMLVAAAATALAVAAPRVRHRYWLWLAGWTWLAGAAALLREGTIRASWLPATGAALLWFSLAGLQAWAPGARQFRRESPGGRLPRLMVGLGAAFVVAACWWSPSERAGLLVGGLGLWGMILLTWVWVSGLRFAAWGCWLLLAGWLHLHGTPAWPTALAVGTAWVPVLVWGLHPALRPVGPPSTKRRFEVQATQAWLAAAVGLVALWETQSGTDALVWLLGSTIALLVLAGWRIPTLAGVARCYAAVGWAWAFALVLLGYASRWGAMAMAMLGLAVLVAVVPLRLPSAGAARSRGAVLAAAAGLALAYAWALSQTGRLQPFITVLWGVTALGWFALGLVGRSRAHRLVGLAGILCCVPRVFIVDLQSTLYRIAAFVVLGIVLLWVGFSYHRFRGWITEGKGDPSEGKN